MPQFNEIDSDVLHKAMQYFKNAYEEAIETKEAAIRTEIAIKEFIKDCASFLIYISLHKKLQYIITTNK